MNTVLSVPDSDEPSITEAMIDAGEEAIRTEIGDPDCLSGFFSARELAIKVFRAMEKRRC